LSSSISNTTEPAENSLRKPQWINTSVTPTVVATIVGMTDVIPAGKLPGGRGESAVSEPPRFEVGGCLGVLRVVSPFLTARCARGGGTVMEAVAPAVVVTLAWMFVLTVLVRNLSPGSP
jgi:hypothetical protein